MRELYANVSAAGAAGQFDANLLIGPAAVLLGVVVSQTITVVTDRRRHTAEQLKDARLSAEGLLSTFQGYRDQIVENRSIVKSDPTRFERDEWQEVRSEAARAAAVLTGSGGHRYVLEQFIEGLTHEEGLAREGLGLTSAVHRDYWLMADFGYQTVASWLRYESVPRGARRYAAKLRRNLYWYHLEMQSRHTYESTGTYPKSGLVRRAWRATVRWVRDDTKTARADFKAAMAYLFRA